MLRKFRKQIEEPTIVSTPVNLSHQYRYRKNHSTYIVKRDHDRGQIIDYLIANLFKVYLLLFDRNWIEAFLIIYGSVTVIDDFNELILNIRHTFILALLLKKMEMGNEAMKVLEYLRDLVEDTNNNKEAILVYEEMGKIHQEKRDYQKAIMAFKKMLQVSWQENDTLQETNAYDYLAMQYFYLQQLQKAKIYKEKAMNGDIEPDDSVYKK